MSYATFRMKRLITIAAIGSRSGNPSLAPRTPIREPIDENASER